MGRGTEDGAGVPGRWRMVVWSVAAFLWPMSLAAIHVTVGLTLARTAAASLILLLPPGTYELGLALQARGTMYRAAVGAALAAVVLLVLANGAVGIIGSENQPANRMYAGVLLVGIVGAAIARLRPHRMAITLFAMAFAQLLVPVLALVIWQSQLSWGGAGMRGVFVINGFFAMLFVGSALLFRRASQRQPAGGSQ